MHKIFVVFLFVTICAAGVWWGYAIYRHMTVAEPTYGGKYVEALVGQPHYINPLLARSSVDNSLTRLVYSGLFAYDKNGMLQPDMVESYEISDDAKEFVVHLRSDVYWHDGEQCTADDVLFTISIAKNIDYGAVGVSSDLRLLWQSVKAEKVDDLTMKFTLEKPDSLFLHNLVFGILPEHLWGNVAPEQFQLTEYNQQPIGTGPYEFADVNINEEEDVIDSYVLRAYKGFYKGEPYITKVVMYFYATRLDAIEAYLHGKVTGVVVDQKEHVDALHETAHKQSIALPHYFAVFFNQTKSVPLAYDEVREALSLATDRQQIIAEVFGDDAVVRYAPFADGMIGYDGEQQQPSFDKEKAKKLLAEKGWNEQDDGIRQKDGQRLSILLHVSKNHVQYIKIAQMLKEQWKDVGVELHIQEHEKADLESNVLQSRDYDAVLYAHQMRFEPNLLPLWHSREKDDPGVNFALLDDKDMDAALDDILKIKNQDERNAQYKKQQEILKKEVPAVFLFAPKISFMHVEGLKGVATERANTTYDRYADIESWFIKQKRVRKNAQKQ